MKIAVLGSRGQLGRDLVSRSAGQAVVPLTRTEIDLAKPDTIPALLASVKPDVLVNCAAYNFVDQAETEPDAAMAVNAWGVRALAAACRDANVKLVHFSTDYVFGLDSSRTRPFAETDAPGPVSVYGISKLAGEYAVLAADPRHLVIRTCGLYGVWGSGGKGGNFVETMLKLAASGKPLKVVNDQFCTPSYTGDVADATIGMIRDGLSGLFHVTNEGAVSWHDFAAGIFEVAGVKADLSPTTSEEFKRPAKRPPYSVLSNAKLVAAGVPAPRPWREALQAYVEERKSQSISR
ncbi:MAG: dTDP-4-dehydrorhamnose reductase [Gemmataceae bacterium]